MGLSLAEKGVNLVVYRDAGIVRDYTGSESILLGFFAAAFILVSVFPYEKVGVWTRRLSAQPQQSLDLHQCARVQ